MAPCAPLFFSFVYPPVMRIFFRMGVCSAACRGTAQRPRVHPEGGAGGGMAEGTPSRFVGDDGEVEVESEKDEIPREWPAYRRAYAALC